MGKSHDEPENTNCHTGKFENEFTVRCDCCTATLSKIIRKEFKKGDIIGITFIEQGTASIASGFFQKIIGTVVVVKDLLVENTTSFVPLCDVDSIEKGLTLDQCKPTIKVSLINKTPT